MIRSGFIFNMKSIRTLDFEKTYNNNLGINKKELVNVVSQHTLYNQYKLKDSTPIFKGAQTRKLIQKLENAERLNKVEITFEELERMFNEIGYDIIRKKGSHATIHLTDDISITIVIPHKTKYVNTNDLRRFLLVKQGKFKEAFCINR